MAERTKDKKTKKTASAAEADRYIEAVGRRKTAIARVRLFKSEKQSFEVNNREFDKYFPVEDLRAIVRNTFKSAEIPQKFKIIARIKGGGISAQSEAMRLGIARALVLYDSDLRKKLKKAGLLKRDSREKERRKFGLKKARKAAQWSKR
jgi:small subunit ribosomal protein S9